MNSRAYVNGRIFSPRGWLDGLCLLAEGERIQAIASPDDPRLRHAEQIDLHGQWLLPGFIDTQVNGGGGVLFNDHPTPAGIAAIGRAHARFGTTGFLPTLVSDSLECIEAAIAATDAAIATGVPGVLGLHIEGPFLNEDRKGVHEAKYLRELGVEHVPLLGSLTRGRTLVTLAPERTHDEVLRQLVARGVILACGHSNASATRVEQALQQGLRGFTHLFNAMSPLTSREPGVVGAALAADHCWLGIIVDGRHVDPRTLRIALRAHPHERFMLVTDAMPCVGTELSHFELQGRAMHVRDGYCEDSQGTLAGTALDMARCVRNAVDLLGIDPLLAVRMASEFPADFLGLHASHGRLEPGLRADLVACDERFHVSNTWIGGRTPEEWQA